MIAPGSAPIAFLSVFKSGTHAARFMLSALTGLPIFEPPIVPGRVDYEDADQLMLQRDHVYSWHLVPTPEVQRRLREAQARPVFLLRNPCDLAVSMYHHFADNIDADIGRGRNVARHFSDLSPRTGLLGIIEGLHRPDFQWEGLGPHLRQMESMLEFAEAYPCFVTTFATLTGPTKRSELVRLARSLGLDPGDTQIDEVVEASSFESMRARATARGRGSHYRKGKAGGHRGVLDPDHRAAIDRQRAQHAPNLNELLARHGLTF